MDTNFLKIYGGNNNKKHFCLQFIKHSIKHFIKLRKFIYFSGARFVDLSHATGVTHPHVVTPALSRIDSILSVPTWTM